MFYKIAGGITGTALLMVGVSTAYAGEIPCEVGTPGDTNCQQGAYDRPSPSQSLGFPMALNSGSTTGTVGGVEGDVSPSSNASPQVVAQAGSSSGSPHPSVKQILGSWHVTGLGFLGTSMNLSVTLKGGLTGKVDVDVTSLATAPNGPGVALFESGSYAYDPKNGHLGMELIYHEVRGADAYEFSFAGYLNSDGTGASFWTNMHAPMSIQGGKVKYGPWTTVAGGTGVAAFRK